MFQWWIHDVEKIFSTSWVNPRGAKGEFPPLLIAVVSLYLTLCLANFCTFCTFAPHEPIKKKIKPWICYCYVGMKIIDI